MVKAEVTLVRDSASTGWTDTERLSLLGRSGRILAVMLREDATEEYGSAANLYIAKASSSLSSAPDDLDTFYSSGSLAVTDSATEASLMDALPVPSPYLVDAIGDVRMAANITAGSGSNDTHLHVVVYAEVWD